MVAAGREVLALVKDVLGQVRQAAIAALAVEAHETGVSAWSCSFAFLFEADAFGRMTATR